MPDLFGKLKGGAEKVAFEADKLARVNKAQGEVNQIKKQMDTLYVQLGEKVIPAVRPPGGRGP